MSVTSKFYEIDGILYPRVTKILGVIDKPALVMWASNQQRAADMAAALELYKTIDAGSPKMSDAAFIISLEQRIGREKAHLKTMNAAMEIGSQAHARCEWVLNKMLGIEAPEPVVSEKALWASMAAEDWIKETGFVPVFVEQTVHSSKHLYAGTADFWGLIKDTLVLGDFKTGKSIYDESLLQVAAYVSAFEEMGHGRAEKAVILRLPKVETDPAFEARWIEREELTANFQTFLNVKKVWEWKDKMDESYQARRKAAKQKEAPVAAATF